MKYTEMNLNAREAWLLIWVRLLAGLSFIGFGLWTLRGDELGDEDKLKEGRFGPLLTVAFAFFLAELGDKTGTPPRNSYVKCPTASPGWLLFQSSARSALWN